ncbi:gamma-glutamyl-gamma-aminobutyrate hydrolase family protein [Nitratiruptor sp. YY09-18]|uniref:gamma-glutamyl-gamma-aminobutyrate hydrolase family protein n=1 Tax=Nitratiruptor sp. YY09-18 TaxID=2724901 RepID=UPI0019150EC0|nr:gamma-glutamyl-gamma-aminobutyrate hydrolase family protein [Nitratiruptor sp. YY09-18]BCD67641.1 putative glutamine amidotransferase [Nitratiruptor sp. YY09-18]
MAQRRVVVTGSAGKNRISWFFIGSILRLLGAKPLFVHEKKSPPSHFDALLLAGGEDICPSSYGAKDEQCNKGRDELELSLLDTAIAKNMPVLGICRGMQMINIYFGGTLYPHIHDFIESHPNSPFLVNPITIKPHTLLHTILQTHYIKANALHHQAIKDLGKELRINAYDKNSIIQGIEHTHRLILGLQWHPEYLPYHPLHLRIFKAFLSK